MDKRIANISYIVMYRYRYYGASHNFSRRPIKQFIIKDVNLLVQTWCESAEKRDTRAHAATCFLSFLKKGARRCPAKDDRRRQYLRRRVHHHRRVEENKVWLGFSNASEAGHADDYKSEALCFAVYKKREMSAASLFQYLGSSRWISTCSDATMVILFICNKL